VGGHIVGFSTIYIMLYDNRNNVNDKGIANKAHYLGTPGAR
jgi:hypothetical protein